MSTSEPSDQELLQCPEAVEPQFIHRGRADMITPQAGKSKKKLKKKRGGGLGQFLTQVTRSLVICFNVNMVAYSHLTGRLSWLGTCVLWSLVDSSV